MWIENRPTNITISIANFPRAYFCLVWRWQIEIRHFRFIQVVRLNFCELVRFQFVHSVNRLLANSLREIRLVLVFSLVRIALLAVYVVCRCVEKWCSSVASPWQPSSTSSSVVFLDVDEQTCSLPARRRLSTAKRRAQRWRELSLAVRRLLCRHLYVRSTHSEET